MRVDYRSFLDKIWEALPAAEYVAMASDPHVLGNPLLKTQHFIGSSKWEYVSETEAIGWHQLRVPHQRYTDESRKEVAVKGHAHGSNQHWYKRIEGVWKFAGLAPIIRWGEFDFDSVFASGRETFGDKEKVKEQVAVAAGVSADVGEANAKTNLESATATVQDEPRTTTKPTAKTADAAKQSNSNMPSVGSADHKKGNKPSAENPPVEDPQGVQLEPTDQAVRNTSTTSPSQQPGITKALADHHPMPHSGQPTAVPTPSLPNQAKEPVAEVQPDQDQIELLKMAREDGKLFEMQVEQVPPEEVAIAL